MPRVQVLEAEDGTYTGKEDHHSCWNFIAQIQAAHSGFTGEGYVDTYNEIDHSSKIRFLLYTCDMDVLAIIETNSIFQRQGHSDKDWYEKQLEAYEQVYPNLIKHNSNFPTAENINTLIIL